MFPVAVEARMDQQRGRAALALAFSLLWVLLAGACAVAPEEPGTAPPDQRFPLTLNGVTIQVELAVTQEEQSRGLMFRESLEPDSGMLFVNRFPRRVAFYMRHTPLPLDIGYFTASGVLREVYALHPFDETTVASQSSQIQFALEMEQGWFAANGIRRGAQLRLDDVAAALHSRGFEPEEYGLGE